MEITAPEKSRTESFITYLNELERKEDRAALAALRRSLGKSPGEAANAHRHILRFNPPHYEEKAWYLVAGLFALHPKDWSRAEGKEGATNFGASFARLNHLSESGSLEKRFVALLNSHEDDLSEHLRHAVSLLKTRDIPVNWLQLLRDLRNWNHANRFVQRQWARAFWGGVAEDQVAPAAGATSTLSSATED
jgi:CRISPR system Cascade subunit CasB